MHLVDNSLLGSNLGFRHVYLVIQILRIKLGKDLSLLHCIPFIDEDFRDAVAVSEGKGNFPEIDIAVQFKLAGSKLSLLLFVIFVKRENEENGKNDGADSKFPLMVLYGFHHFPSPPAFSSF